MLEGAIRDSGGRGTYKGCSLPSLRIYPVCGYETISILLPIALSRSAVPIVDRLHLVGQILH